MSYRFILRHSSARIVLAALLLSGAGLGASLADTVDPFKNGVRFRTVPSDSGQPEVRPAEFMFAGMPPLA